MEQLEQFEFEKQYLLNQNLASQQEMKKLSEKYGNILGHQNNKQKIKHISKYSSLLFSYLKGFMSYVSREVIYRIR